MSGFCSKCGKELPADARFCPYCGTPVDSAAPGNPDEPSSSSDSRNRPGDEDAQTAYDVFLSYSHHDRNTFGMDYILRIKEEIEKSLANLVDHPGPPRVFLDAEALHLGDLWHSRIMAGLHKSKVFVCLVSEHYLTSSYCARERLWWAAKQTRDGRFLDRPYPVYFVELKDKHRSDAKELMAVEMDREPWFREFRKELQEEFIRERLEKIRTAVSSKFQADRKAKNYCSILPPLYDNFVGRVTELRELYEHCVNGKYPVLQAFGGVGKTELSVAYAYGFADQYPMGRFLFRMEGVNSWDEAFASALSMEGIDANGQSKNVFEELNIVMEGKSQKELHQAAAKAFLERAANKQMLILLDNLDEETTLLKPSRMREFLCDNPIPSNIHIIGTTRGAFQFSERESFLSYNLNNLKDDEAFEMLCLTGNGLYPFDMRPPDAGNKEYQAALGVIHLLGGHAWSMEIMSAFMADNYDSEGFNFAMELESLRKENVLSISSEVGSYREKEKAATSVKLLMPTLDKLATLELGEEIMELAVFAACFDPDEIPMYLLKDYWNLNFPDVKCSTGIPFFYAMNKLAKYHLLRKDKDFCKMHRLVQSVFLTRKEKYLPHIIKTLPKCSFIPKKYWLFLLKQNPDLADACPQDGTFDIDDWEKLMAIDPNFVEKCPWHLFPGNVWVRLLVDHPEYASHQPPWEALDSWGWMYLLSFRPQFADKCNWKKLNGFDWGRLLKDQPKFADKCDWNSLNGAAWEVLLKYQPKFADRCDWSKLNGRDWSSLLEEQPRFADKCDWSKLDGRDWVNLLKKKPEWSVNIQFSYLDTDSWAILLGEFPQFVKNCNLSYLSGKHWAKLLEAQPQFADKCDWSKLDGQNWSSLLIRRANLAKYCDWSKLNGKEWTTLLVRQPQFADHCDWSKLDGQNWIALLMRQPRFADKCDWNKLGDDSRKPWKKAWDDDNLGDLLDNHPELANRCVWSTLNGWSWAKLLAHRPEFADKCDWSKLKGQDWAWLLDDQPQFADKCDWSRLDERDWTRLLERLPQFANRCDWSKMTNGWDLSCLLREQPQLAGLCDWSVLKGRDWVELLRVRPSFADKCDWNKLDGRDWTFLIDVHPQFADKCDWSKMDGWCWCSILARYPQFADKCDWDKLSGWDFSGLLGDQPQFADKCDWNTLNGWAWARLLSKQPQFADNCDWSLLDGREWRSLLEDQPQFFDKCDPSKLSEEDRQELLEQYPQLRKKC